MIERLISAVADWPVIVQGAIGSGLFWMILLFGQKASFLVSARYGESSRKRRRAFLIDERAKYRYQSVTEPAAKSAIATALLFRAFRTFLRGMVWLTLGLLVSGALPVLGTVGYFGCLYYLFAALNTVRSVEVAPDAQAKADALSEEIIKLDVA